MKLPDGLSALLLAGAPVTLQRVTPGQTAEQFAAAWAALAGTPVSVATDLFGPQRPSVVDLRGGVDFSWLDARRSDLAAIPGQMLVLVDVQTGRALLRQAPQTASWAGGVHLPHPSAVRPARTDQEVQLGREMLARALREAGPAVHRKSGESVGLNLADARLFFREPHRRPLEAAEEELDEGIIYVGRVPRA